MQVIISKYHTLFIIWSEQYVYTTLPSFQIKGRAPFAQAERPSEYLAFWTGSRPFWVADRVQREKRSLLCQKLIQMDTIYPSFRAPLKNAPKA